MSEFQDENFGDNPYRSPFSGGEAPFGGDESGQVVTHKVLAMLRQTQPWVRFLSILGFIIATLMILVGAIGSVAMFARPGISPAQLVVFLVYIPMGVLYFFPAFFLFQYASRINALWTTRSVRQLEEALEAQKSFWKFVGILMLLVILLYVLGIVFAFVFAAAAVH